jgi:hypothetical protein
MLEQNRWGTLDKGMFQNEQGEHLEVISKPVSIRHYTYIKYHRKKLGKG